MYTVVHHCRSVYDSLSVYQMYQRHRRWCRGSRVLRRRGGGNGGFTQSHARAQEMAI